MTELQEKYYHDGRPLHIKRSSDVAYTSYVKYVASAFKTLVHLNNIENDDISKE